MNLELLQALKTAYNAEVEGMRAYLKFAKQTEVVSGKNMLIQLALDEIDHMELVGKFMEKMIKGEVYEGAEVPKGRLSGFMPDVSDASLQKTEKATVGDDEALKIALVHEEKARDFYLEQAEKADDPAAKKLFSDLAAVEQKHFEIIRAEMEFIQQDGFWFDMMEFSLEK
ncbi:ferritin family protein [Limisalsivibrio acetivorans]|uniref:ferritin family protein n=1 Tax=Limisalsivibrio acetivorans TaxID=1304888 RepID=UPI0003B382BF|nr:ferritin family protein [Limisalsivibrio acetivorans]